MAQPRQSASSSSLSRTCPLSANSTMCPAAGQESPTLLSMLPSMVRGRLSRLPSLRRSVSMYSLSACSAIKFRTETPSDENTTMVLSVPKLRAVGTDLARLGVFVDELEDNREVLAKGHRKSMELTEQKSGIGWKFASQGLSLLSLSVSESNHLSQRIESSTASPPFARQLYIHALTYLLRGLPADLTSEESVSIRSALPSVVTALPGLEFGGTEIHSYHNSKSIRSGHNHSHPSLLHRTLAASIVYLFILVRFLLPYIKIFLQAAYEHERSHRIAEKVLAGSIEAVDGLGKIGIRGGVAIWGSGLALGVGEAVSWFVEGVSGGIQEGLGEGMARIGVRKELTPKQANEL